MLTSERAEASSGMAGSCRLQEHVRAAEKDSEAPHVARARVEALTTERALMIEGTEQAEAEGDNLPAQITELSFQRRMATDG